MIRRVAVGAHGEAALVAGAGHAPHLERPAAFAALLDTLLSRELDLQEDTHGARLAFRW